jgi:glycosyltransferase involved in cell wall biosynthesis
MRIAYDHQIFGWQKYGGVSRYFYEIASRMPAVCKCDVRIYSPVFVNRYLKENTPPYVVGIPFITIPKSGRAIQIINSYLVRYLLHRDMPDVLHETYYYEKRLAHRKTKTVLTVYDMVHEKFAQYFRSGDKTRLMKKEAVKRADHIICISENTRKDLIEILDADHRKTTVVYLGNAITSARMVESGRLVAQPYIAYVGLRRGYKNFSKLLHAYASSELLKKNYIVACFGGGRLNESENREIADLKIPSDAVIHLEGDDNDLAAFYRYAEIFVYPSFYEGFGMPPLEAMSFDCPVACSKVSSMPEVVGNAGAYFDPDDIDDMRTAIEMIVSDEALRTRLIAAGRERIKEFSWDKCASETLNVYKKVVS